MKSLEKIKNCEVCRKTLKKNLLDLGNHPMCDDLIKIGSNKNAKLYPLVLNICNFCLTVSQHFYINKKKLFPKKYHYRARFTQDVVNGQKDLVQTTEKLFGELKNKIVLDIGANDCSLLNQFKKKDAYTIGIEPTNAIKDGANYHIKFQSYFDSKIVRIIKNKYNSIDFITFTNVFAHIDNLPKLIFNLKKLLSDKTVLIIENHYLGSVLEKKQFDTFYSEHIRTYSFHSFISIAKFLGLQIIFTEFPKRYGGNIRVFLSKTNSIINFDNKKVTKILLKEKKFFNEFKKMIFFIKKWKKKKKEIITKLNNKFGPLPAKAFPGRAAIILNLLGLTEKNISTIYEKSMSKKIGYYAPGTRIKIQSDDQLFLIKNNIPVINLAWHIDKEIKTYLKKNKFNNKVISIIEKKDFI
jgi:hypothetical protein